MNGKWKASAAVGVERAGRAFLVPLREPLEDAVEISGSGLDIWDEICASSHGITLAALIDKIAALYSTDVSEIALPVEEFVLSLRDRGLVLAADQSASDGE
ncbi:PqqD family peptide modification chaperone [Rathayibacter sp. VKM Ac-2857]|uniref:PqqD family peptide modification chaperone n=1 Tax=Rathayibacter sp. VKM Ac-2857 TaxID=2739020 RepID=UPI00156771B4|nr:PqqD family peptide modification chaperone [Rathayibacter sp. VKM Ac-2857]NQX14731.1 PqqD family peptide modification chaperone [Rathayibacter sp. VKM Ac-2857]